MLNLLLRFCLLGSFVGGGAFVAARDIATSSAGTSQGVSALMNVLGIPVWAVLTSFLSIPLGALPSTIAALIYWGILARATIENPSALARAAIGGGVGCLSAATFGGLFFTVGSGPGGYPVAVNLLSWAVAGIAGGAVAAASAGAATYKQLPSTQGAQSGA